MQTDQEQWYEERGWAFDASMDYSIEIACQPWWKYLWNRLTADHSAIILSRKSLYVNNPNNTHK